MSKLAAFLISTCFLEDFDILFLVPFFIPDVSSLNDPLLAKLAYVSQNGMKIYKSLLVPIAESLRYFQLLYFAFKLKRDCKVNSWRLSYCLRLVL
jgi:hypothetical protein